MKKALFTLLTLLAYQFSIANNVAVSNIGITGQNTTAHYSMIHFDVTWDNSWRTSTNESNYDGAWVFVKFRKKNAFNWQHCTINYATGGAAAASGHTQPTGSTLQTSADGKGIWIYRDANGSGTVNFTGASLRWNYGVDGVADNDSVEVRLFAVEMVYIPQGAFILGSNGTENNHFRRGDKDTCFNVTSENSITVGTTATQLSSHPATTSLATGTIAASFPKGFAAFWSMKYEVSQQQYCDFLNTIDAAKATARNPSASIYTGTHPNFITATPEIVAGSLSNEDVMSLLDWSGMRPMTEFEFEKACRGANMAPTPNEYPWGTTAYSPIATPTDQGLSTETWATGNCNYANNTLMRCGALATGTSNRSQSGATFYGIMEMGGNVYEMTVNANSSGRTYTGLHGDGNLDNTGSYDVTNWPTTATAFGLRGNSTTSVYPSYNNPNYLSISDRNFYASGGLTNRGATYGGRGVRTAE